MLYSSVGYFQVVSVLAIYLPTISNIDILVILAVLGCKYTSRYLRL